jgi:uncharacterized protein YjeT (DUF2065 family)
MQVSWGELGRYFCGAFALYLVLEGILPFLNPRAAQRLMLRMSQMSANQLRWGGLLSMALGVGLLWVVRNG